MSVKTLLKNYIVLPALRYLEEDSSNTESQDNAGLANSQNQYNRENKSENRVAAQPTGGFWGHEEERPPVCGHTADCDP